MKINYYKLGVFLFLSGIMSLFSACKKNEMPPSSKGDPVLFVKGKFMGQIIEAQVDDSTCTALQFNNINPANNVRSFHFQFSMTDPNKPYSYLFQFINYKTPNGNLITDIDSTFKPGFKELSNYFPPQSNPYNLNTMNFSFYSGTGNYTSEKFTSDSSYIKIDSVNTIKWHDGIDYTLVYMSISANMRSADIMDTLNVYPFTDGKACIAFPRE